jgi:carbamoyltransferase
MKILGLMSSHDCSFAILEDGRPTFHAELERYIRKKEPEGDPFAFFQSVCGEDAWKDFDTITVCHGFVKHMEANYPDGLKKLIDISNNNKIPIYSVGHHQSHAANAFYSSNFEDALIVTLDGGGLDMDTRKKLIPTSYTVWEGSGNKMKNLSMIHSNILNIGFAWQRVTKLVFGLSSGYPKGNQAGTVMAMACMGNADKYLDYFEKFNFTNSAFHFDSRKNEKLFDFVKMREIASRSEQDAFDVAAALQKATENKVKQIFDFLVEKTDKKYLCLSGGVVLNSVITGKLFEWYGDKFEEIYVCPVSYDAGIAIGSAQYFWHYTKNNPRIEWTNNATPFLGETYQKSDIESAIHGRGLKVEKAEIEEIVDLLDKQNIISVFSGPSESGRRALGNRSILADPRQLKMKDTINEKVKHRQWYRPFAPSILREKVSEWFDLDIDSPYMSYVIDFKEEVRSRVPAVVHIDGTARLQTVTREDNGWYYELIKKWDEKTGIPIILNTSFNDREPIVETPQHAVSCFMGTNIDYLYFVDAKILVSK